MPDAATCHVRLLRRRSYQRYDHDHDHFTSREARPPLSEGGDCVQDRLSGCDPSRSPVRQRLAGRTYRERCARVRNWLEKRFSCRTCIAQPGGTSSVVKGEPGPRISTAPRRSTRHSACRRGHPTTETLSLGRLVTDSSAPQRRFRERTLQRTIAVRAQWMDDT